jgi:hypothetical protein
MRKAAVSLFAAIVGVTAAAQVRAGTPAQDLLNSRFSFDLGGFVLTSTTNGGLSGTANTSDQTIDFDKQFGLDAEQTRWRAGLAWRMTQRQYLRLMYFDNDVKHTRPINADLVWGDYTFTAGGQVTAENKFRVAELDYEFAFLRKPNYAILVSAGIHVDDLTLKLSGDATITTETPTGVVQQPQTFSTKSSSVPAPLPVLGVRGEWAASQHLYVAASAQVFVLSYQGISGNWSDLQGGVAWMFNRHFGIGVGYDRFVTHVDFSKANFNGRLNFGYRGALLYLVAGF